MTTPRYLEPPVSEDLSRKMVLVAGPRQVGKTTLARRILATHGPGVYLSWDNRDDRRDIRAARWPGGSNLIVLDELHKWRGWKRWIKGEFDKHRDRLRFLVTGSARLDVYRRGGDSLQADIIITVCTRSQSPKPKARLPPPRCGLVQNSPSLRRALPTPCLP